MSEYNTDTVFFVQWTNQNKEYVEREFATLADLIRFVKEEGLAEIPQEQP